MQENRALKSIHKASEALKLPLLRRTRSNEFFDVVPEVAVAIYAKDELQGYRSSNGNPRAPIWRPKITRGVAGSVGIAL
jgi:hypothetical protein